MEKIVDLLTALSQSLKENNCRRISEDNFNIFNVLGVQSKEVILCRFIGELLDPNGNHDLGTIPLKRFFEIVLNEKITESQALDAKVKLEDLIDKQRRVDIAIFIGNKVYPIEAKVWAGDQNAQLYDYYNYYKKDKVINKIYYLTPTGKNPSEESVVTLTSDKVQCLSFEKEILNWIESIEPVDECNLKSSCKQFMEVILNMVNEHKNIKSISDVLNLDDGNSYKNNDLLKAAIILLNDKDDLIKKIITNYLKSKIIFDNNRYEMLECDGNESIKHSYMKINHKGTGKTIAWICVETNLYIVAKKVTNKNIWVEYADDYFWQYIHPNGKASKFPLKKLDCIFEYDNSIEIGRYLDTAVNK